jgi:hypothetical protein
VGCLLAQRLDVGGAPGEPSGRGCKLGVLAVERLKLGKPSICSIVPG